MTTRPTFILSADQSAATVTIAAQTDRSALTPHTLTATRGGGTITVLWSSSSGTFDDATSLTPTYTPTTIGHQEVICTPTGPLGAGAPTREAWDVTRPPPVAANATPRGVISTLALQTEALSDTAGADGVTWGTVVQRYTTAGVLQGTETVGGTSTAPTWTPSALDRQYVVTSTATDAYSRTSVVIRSVSAIAADVPTGNIGVDTSQNVLDPITLDGSAIVGATSFLWSADVLEPADCTYTSTATPDAPTSQSTTFTPDGVGDLRIKCVATNATGSTTFERQVSQTRPYPVVSSSLGSTEELAGATYAPTLSETAGADAPATPWLTTALLDSDGSSVSVTGSTTTTPSIGSIVAGAAYVVTHQYTDAYGRVGRLSVGVRRTPAAIVPIVFSTPSPQTLTAAGAADITFTGASGGTPGYTYSGATLAKPAGSAATILSGSGVGPYAIVADVEGTYTITLTVTDSVGVTNQATGVVTYSSASSSWTTLETIDWTSCTTTSRSSAGTLSVYENDGTTLKKDINCSNQGTVTVETFAATSGTGVTVTMTTGTGTAVMLWQCAAATSGAYKLAYQSLSTPPAYGASTSHAPAIISTQSTIAAGTQFYQSSTGSGGNAVYKLQYRVGGSSNPSANQTVAESGNYVCSTLIVDGDRCYFYIHHDVSDFVPLDTIYTGAEVGPFMGGPSSVTPVAYAQLVTNQPWVGLFSGAVPGAVTTVRKTRFAQAKGGE